MSQHDYVIDNADGATARADINTALAAIASQNSGATEPSTTYAYMVWADTASGYFKQRNASNDAWIVLWPLASGIYQERYFQLLIEDGTTAGTIKCSTVAITGVASGLIGNVISAEDNLAKSASTTSFSLDSNGDQVQIKSSALTGTVSAVGVIGWQTNSNMSTPQVTVVASIVSRGIEIQVRNADGSTPDLTSTVGTGVMRVNLRYIVVL